MSTANEIRVGLIGFGFAGKTFHAPLIQATEGLRIVAVASGDAAKVHAALGPDVTVTTAPLLIARDDIDLVVIATPNDLHHPQALAALTAGRHVVIDKPFALSVAQARELIEAAQARRVLLSVFHNRRWDSDFLTLAHVLREGTLGRIVEVVSHFDRFRPQVRARWRESSAPGAGLWFDLGPHLIDQALRLFGAPSAIALDVAAQRDGALSDDWFHAQLRWTDGPHAGLRVRLHASALVARPTERFTVHGTRGSFVVEGLDVQEDALKAGADRQALTAKDWGRDPRAAFLWLGNGDGSAIRKETIPLLNGAYPAYYAAVRDAVRGVAPNPVPADEALAVQMLIERGLQAARERREVALSG
jgi:predicted dehydrogenase